MFPSPGMRVGFGLGHSTIRIPPIPLLLGFHILGSNDASCFAVTCHKMIALTPKRKISNEIIRASNRLIHQRQASS